MPERNKTPCTKKHPISVSTKDSLCGRCGAARISVCMVKDNEAGEGLSWADWQWPAASRSWVGVRATGSESLDTQLVRSATRREGQRL